MAFSPYGYLSDSLDYRHLEFEVMALGHRLPVTFERIDTVKWRSYVPNAVSSLPVWDLSIQPGDSLNLGMRYKAIWSGDSIWRFAYNARPASLWAGTIGYAMIEFEFEEFTAALLRCAESGPGPIRVAFSPAGARWIGDSLVWEFRDWEPTEDVGIEVSAHGK